MLCASAEGDQFTAVNVRRLSSSAFIPGTFASAETEEGVYRGLIRTGTCTRSPTTSGNVGCWQTPAQVLSFSHTHRQSEEEEEDEEEHTYTHKRIKPGPLSPLMFL